MSHLGIGVLTDSDLHRLNLAVATRIYLLEPQWNPSIESQAIGRALRLGQTDQVVIIRYIMKDTIEEVRLRLRSLSFRLLIDLRAMSYFAKRESSRWLVEDSTNLKRSRHYG